VGNVIEFPSQSVQGWAAVERALRRIFAEAAAPAGMQDKVLSQMRDAFRRYSVKFSVPLELPVNLTGSTKGGHFFISRARVQKLRDAVARLHGPHPSGTLAAGG
jgi:hypothetical protein